MSGLFKNSLGVQEVEYFCEEMLGGRIGNAGTWMTEGCRGADRYLGISWTSVFLTWHFDFIRYLVNVCS